MCCTILCASKRYTLYTDASPTGTARAQNKYGLQPSPAQVSNNRYMIYLLCSSLAGATLISLTVVHCAGYYSIHLHNNETPFPHSFSNSYSFWTATSSFASLDYIASVAQYSIPYSHLPNLNFGFINVGFPFRHDLLINV